MKVIVAGDFCDNARVSPVIASGDFSSLLGEVKDVIGTADVRVVNLEFPVVRGVGRPIEKCGPCLKGQKQAIDAVRYAGFNVCTLANNHIMDQGPECFLYTKDLLDTCGIETVGAGADIIDAGRVLYCKVGNETLAIINCCEHEFSIAGVDTPGANPLNPVRQYYSIREAKGQADYVMVIVHGGHEHYQLPSPRMQEVYRFFLDVGADVVINHHQHCVSGYEVYNDKPIFYGLGNFLFDMDGRRKSIWNEGALLSITFEPGKPASFDMIPYKQCDSNVGVTLMNGDDLGRFKESISKLNEDIFDSSRLASKHEQWMASTSRSYELLFQPYRSTVAKSLYKRGLLPSWIGRRKKSLIINRLMCESHLDRLRYSVIHIK